MGVPYLVRREIPASTNVYWVCEGVGKRPCGELVHADVPTPVGSTVETDQYCCEAKYRLTRLATGNIDIQQVVPKVKKRGARTKAR